MTRYPSDIAFTDSVKQVQSEKGSRSTYEGVESGRGWQTTVTPELRHFLSSLDMFYLGTANAEGQPYIQYRGGSPGFLRVIDESTLGFAEFGGNRQYITLGNLRENPRAFLFLIDYVNRSRIKLWGEAHVVEGDDELLKRLGDPTYPAEIERAVLFSIEAWDVNCPQHIHQRFPRSSFGPTIEKLQDRVRELEARLAEVE